jgi:hypothetical protein
VSSHTIIFLLPYVVSVLVKLWSIVADRRLMLGTLDRLASLPKPQQVQFELDTNQQRVIVAHLIQGSLKSSIVITFFSSFVAATVTLFESPRHQWTPVSLVLILLIGFAMLAWVIPSRAPELIARGWLGIRKGTWALLCSCVYDVILGTAAYYSLTNS